MLGASVVPFQSWCGRKNARLKKQESIVQERNKSSVPGTVLNAQGRALQDEHTGGTRDFTCNSEFHGSPIFRQVFRDIWLQHIKYMLGIGAGGGSSARKRWCAR